MKGKLLLILLAPLCLFGQQILQLTQSIPDSAVISKVAFTRYTSKPLPTQTVSIAFGDSLVLKRYYKQRFLMTDTSKSPAVWFSLLAGYDGVNFWVAADTDYDNFFEDEQPLWVSLPAALAKAITGHRYKAAILRFDLHPFQLGESLRHPGFPIFVQPEFCFATESRDNDSLQISPVLLSGHMASGNVSVGENVIQLSMPLYGLMSDISLFTYYNPAHQQKTPVNLQALNAGKPGNFLAFGNAYTLLVKKEPLAIPALNSLLHADGVNWKQKTISLTFSELPSFSMVDSLKSCQPLAAKNIFSGKPLQLPANDSVILYFTGSWCVPCRQLTPKVESYFKQLPPGWQGYVIANERSAEAAQAYLKNYRFQQTFFELLSDKSACSLKGLFSVALYPTLVYLSPDGKIIWRGAGIRGDEETIVPEKLE
jgi:thiol-disulfide isomerase/thioredoxin